MDHDLRERETRVLEPSAAAFAEAAEVLRGGGLVAFATETVYGLGADAADGGAVAGIYAAKGRPSFNPLIAHVADLDAARGIGALDQRATALAEVFWPGPLTMVVPALPDCPVHELARAGLDTVAIRVPAAPVARDLIAAFGGAVVAPSANRSGRISPTSAEHVVADLDGRIDLVIDGGPCPIGVESTVIAVLPDAPIALLRPGGVTRAEIERVTGELPVELAAGTDDESQPLAPGMLTQHYAPHSQVRLGARSAEPGEAVLGFAGQPHGTESSVAHLDLSPTGDLSEAAANLFAYLRALDDLEPRAIAVAPIPADGLGEAINDRLKRAAAR